MGQEVAAVTQEKGGCGLDCVGARREEEMAGY